MCENDHMESWDFFVWYCFADLTNLSLCTIYVLCVFRNKIYYILSIIPADAVDLFEEIWSYVQKISLKNLWIPVNKY